MKPISTIKNKTYTITKLVVVMLLLSNVSMFGQNVENNSKDAITSENTSVTTSVNISENNSMNLYSWFMGTKQTPNPNSKNDESGNIKKQIINSGIEPNRLLLKSFLKKATNYTEVIA